MSVPAWVVAGLLLCAAPILNAQDAEVAAAPISGYDIRTAPFLLGDWGGLRTQLSDAGIAFNFGYETETAHNFSGGTAHLTRYTDQINAGALFDLGKLWNWHGALFNFEITDRNGYDLGAAAHIGNNQLIQEVYGRGQTWHLTDMTLQQKWLDDRISLKLGRMNLGENFDSFSCDFQNLTFCGSPPGNIAGSYWVNWPTSLWAAVLRFATSRDSYLEIGAYQVSPSYVDNRYAEDSGLLPTIPGGTTGALIPMEYGLVTTFWGLPVTYRVGGWYNTSKSPDLYLDVNHEPLALTGAPALEHNGTYGGYLSIEQQVSGVVAGRGVTVFLNVTEADRKTTATDGQIAMGVEYKGIFGRPPDMAGLAIGATHSNGRYGDYQRQYNELHPEDQVVVNDGYEYVSELFYSWSPIQSIVLRPNIQYILHPGGSTENANAFVLGLKTQITF